VNEVAVTAPTHTGMTELALHIAGTQATRYRGDGVILASPLGTTAYNLSAGGPVLNPRLRAITVTPICAHLLTMRSLVVPAEETVEVKFRGSDMATVLIDGRMIHEMRPKDCVRVTEAKEHFLLIETPKRSYYQTLRKKLNWGERPRYGKGNHQ